MLRYSKSGLHWHMDIHHCIYIQALGSQYLGPFIWVLGWWVLGTQAFQTWEFRSRYLGPSIWVPLFRSWVPSPWDPLRAFVPFLCAYFEVTYYTIFYQFIKLNNSMLSYLKKCLTNVQIFLQTFEKQKTQTRILWSASSSSKVWRRSYLQKWRI